MKILKKLFEKLPKKKKTNLKGPKDFGTNFLNAKIYSVYKKLEIIFFMSFLSFHYIIFHYYISDNFVFYLVLFKIILIEEDIR